MSGEQFNIYLEEMNDIFEQSSDENDKDENDDIMNEAVCSSKVVKPEKKPIRTMPTMSKPRPKSIKKIEPRLRFILKPKFIKNINQIRRRRLKNKYIHWSNKRRYERKLLLPQQSHRVDSYEDMEYDMESPPDYRAKQTKNITTIASAVAKIPAPTETIDLDDSDEDDDSDGNYAEDDDDDDDVDDDEDDDDYKNDYRDNYKDDKEHLYENDEENGKEMENDIRMEKNAIKTNENGTEGDRAREFNRKVDPEVIENTSSSSSDYTEKSSSAEDMSPPPPLAKAPTCVPIPTSTSDAIPIAVPIEIPVSTSVQSPAPVSTSVQISAPIVDQTPAAPPEQFSNLNVPAVVVVAAKTPANPETKDCATNTSTDFEYENQDQEIFFNDEMNRLYPFFNRIISQHIRSLRSMESIQERVASMTREVASLKEQIQVKETELNNLIHKKKIREETLWRMMRIIKTFDMQKKSLEGHKFELIALKELEAAITKHAPRPVVKEKLLKDMTATEILSRRAKMTEEELVRESATAGSVESVLNKLYPEYHDGYDAYVSPTRSLSPHSPLRALSPPNQAIQKRRRSGAEAEAEGCSTSNHSSKQYSTQNKRFRPTPKLSPRMQSYNDDNIDNDDDENDDDADDGGQNDYEQKVYKRFKSAPSFSSNMQLNDDERRDKLERPKAIRNGPHISRILQLTEHNDPSDYVDIYDGPFASTLEKLLTNSVLNRSDPKKPNHNNCGIDSRDADGYENREHDEENGEHADENRQHEYEYRERDDEIKQDQIEQRHREVENKQRYVENKLVRSDIPSKNYIPRAELNRERLAVRLESPSTKLCQHCGIHEARFLCAECKNQWYCSRKCQVIAWKDHCDECE